MLMSKRWWMVVLVVAVGLQASCGGAGLGAGQTDQAGPVTPTPPSEAPSPTGTPLPPATSTSAPPTVPPTVIETTVMETTAPSPSPAPPATPVVVLTAGDLQRVAAAEAKALVDEGVAVLYDVRSAASYRDRHAAGAVSFPEADVALRYDDLPADKTLVFY